MPRAKSTATKSKTAAAKSRTPAKRKSSAKSTPRGSRTSTRTVRRNEPGSDAIALLKADHRKVEEYFSQFERARGDDRKRALAANICTALRVHTQIEEEIFYPAFLEATGDEGLHHEAVIEHDGAKKMIAEIESSGPDNEYYDARVNVLSEMIKHHVNEEEQRDGMFAKARSSSMDLAALGQELATRKAELESSPELKALSRAVDVGKGLVTRLTSKI